MAGRPWALRLLLLLMLLGLAQATQAGHALPRKLAAAAPASAPLDSTASSGTSNNTSSGSSNTTSNATSSSSRPTSLVKAAWSITDPQPRTTNGSSAAAGWYPSQAVVAAMRQQMAAHWTLSPGQLRLTALSKLVIGYHFRGVKGWDEDASAALEHAASEAAGGFDPANISADTRPPDLGLPGDMFAASEAPAVQVRDAHTGDPLPGSAAAGTPPGRHRRLLQQAPAGSATSSSSSSQASPGGGDDEGETALQQGEGDIYVTYSKIPPGKADQLLGQLQASCGGLPLTPGTNLTATPCGQATRRHLEAAGLKPQPGYCQLVDTAPLVSLDVTLTLGLNEQQAAAGVGTAIAAWLSQPGHIQAALRSAGAQQDLGDAMVQWLTTPEILVINVQPPQSPAAKPTYTPAFVAGVAIGGAVAIATAIIAILLLRRRYKRQIEAVKSEASNSSATSGNNRQPRRRRREGKRRYLLPDPPAPSTLGPSASAVTGAGAASNSAGDGAAAVDEAGMAGDDDADLPLRPRLRELGDSVTSAVRFEQDDDEEEEEDEQAAAGTDSAAAAAAAAAGPGRQRQRQRSLQQQQSASCFSVPEEGPGSDPPAAAAPGLAAAAVAGGAAAALAAATAASARNASAAETPLQLDCSQVPAAAGPPWQQEALQLPDLPSSSHAAAGHKPSPFCNYNFSQLLELQPTPPAPAAAGDLECQQQQQKQQQQDSRSSRAPSQKEQHHDGLLPLSSSLLQGGGSMRIAVSSDGGVQPLSSPRCSQQQLSGWDGSNCCQRLSSSIALSSGWDGSGMPAATDENGDSASSSTCSSSDRSSRGQRPSGASRLPLGLDEAAAAAALQRATTAKVAPSSLAVGGTAVEAVPGFARLHDLA